jgi:type II secretory pathway pseudopilin PulG
MFPKKLIRSTQGFTLLEIGVVLFILVVLAGMAIPMTSSLIAEERLRQDVRELQLYARTARRLAISESRPYEILFTENGFLLEPYLTGEKAREKEVVRSHAVGSNASYVVQRWGAREFGKPVEESWIFQPDGLCEPIRVHFQSGKGWMEFAFSPLTARAQEETYYFP